MKKVLIVFLTLVLLVSLSSCIRIGGAGDWTFDLPGGYTVIRANNLCIEVIKDRATVVGEYIEAFCFGETYVGVKRIPFDFESGRHEDIEHVPTAYPDTEREYYLLNTASGSLYGPYTAEEFTARCEELAVTDLCDWISTDGWPDGAHD